MLHDTTEVRERRGAALRTGTTIEAAGRPAHPSPRLVAQLGSDWRVVDDPLQWVIQRRKGRPRHKNAGWASLSFCRTREGLLLALRERGCPTNAAVLALPDWHVDRH